MADPPLVCPLLVSALLLQLALLCAALLCSALRKSLPLPVRIRPFPLLCCAVLCSGYFQCRYGALVSLHVCAEGLEYSTSRQACVAPEESSCRAHSGEGPGGLSWHLSFLLSWQ